MKARSSSVPPPRREGLDRGEVHLWHASLHESAARREYLFHNLSEDEKTRARRFHFEGDRTRFTVAHGLLREILARYLSRDPSRLSFRMNPFGKPALINGEALNFNLSHSADVVLIAVASGREVGIDVEQIRQDVAVDHIAERYFTRKEIAGLERLPPRNRRATFFQYWTRKEACVKAIGQGISSPLERCEVAAARGNVWTPVVLPPDGREGSLWFRDVHPGSGYAAAIAVEGRPWEYPSCIRVQWIWQCIDPDAALPANTPNTGKGDNSED